MWPTLTNLMRIYRGLVVVIVVLVNTAALIFSIGNIMCKAFSCHDILTTATNLEKKVANLKRNLTMKTF